MDTIQAVHAITDPTRFRLVLLLLQRHYCVKALAKKLGISEPAVSQHVRVLKQYGIIDGVKIGYQMHYQVDREALSVLFAELGALVNASPSAEAISQGWSCTCEYIDECTKRDAKALREQNHAK